MEINSFYPWHKDLAKKWISSTDRFSHAWLIYGQEGIGKFDFCLAAAKSFLCHYPQPFFCNECNSCHLMDKSNHLDFRIVVPEALRDHYNLNQQELEEFTSSSSTSSKPSNEIKIDQVRELENFFTLSPSLGKTKVVILGPVETLNQASSNSLLKILEEPLGDTIFLLFTHAIQKVIPTILSRCQRLPLPIPNMELSTEWLISRGVKNPKELLSMVSGAPLKALELNESSYEPVQYWVSDFVKDLNSGSLLNYDVYVEKLESIPNTQWLASLQALLTDLILTKQGLNPRFFDSLGDEIRSIATKSNLQRLANLWDYLIDRQKLARHPLNPKLFIHSCLQRVFLSLNK